MMSPAPVLPMIRADRCTGCGDCLEACPAGVLELREGKAVLARPEDCRYCGDCETLCPEGAIALPFEIVFSEPDSDSREVAR